VRWFLTIVDVGHIASHIIMSNFIHDIINDPREYLPFLVMLGGLLISWEACA